MAPHPARVLIADADPETRALLTLLLTSEVAQVDAVASLDDWTARPAAEPVDLILVDGCCATRADFAATAPRILTAAAGTPVVLMTPLPLAPVEAQAHGFRGLVPKPFDIDVLVDQVRATLRADTSS